MAKIACGQSDSLMLSVLRAWDFAVKPAFLCPAMNTVMWEHPVTDETHRKLADWGYNVVKPASKRLACNDVGAGALADVDTIVREVKTLQLGWNIVHENSDFLDSFFEKQRILFITGRKAGDNDNSMVIQMTALSVDTAQVAQPTGTTVLATGGLKYDNSTENGSRSLLRNIICFIALSAVISMVQN